MAKMAATPCLLAPIRSTSAVSISARSVAQLELDAALTIAPATASMLFELIALSHVGSFLLVLILSFNPVYPAVGVAVFLVFVLLIFLWWRRRRALYSDSVTVTHVEDVYSTNHHHHHHQPIYDQCQPTYGVVETHTHHTHYPVHQPVYVSTNNGYQQATGTPYAPDNAGYSGNAVYAQPSPQTTYGQPYRPDNQ